ncbi:MAG TPA: hypothetical protein VL588_07970 [Bdellovibrionota bacterium]|nr:hypothetical protein [Bdellovibrionota bacterium]
MNLFSKQPRQLAVPVLILCVLLSAGCGGAPDPDSIQVWTFLREFRKDPRRVLNTLPLVRDARTGAVLRKAADVPLNADPVLLRGHEAIRQWAVGAEPAGREKIAAGDYQRWTLRFTGVPPDKQIVNAMQIYKAGLSQHQLATIPWSDSYWPTYKGHVARRYADNGYPDSKDWSANHAYAVGAPFWSLYQEGDPETVRRLSPAEKYDLLVGARHGVTDWAWGQGQSLYDQSGKVPEWMGICHGWSGAAHMGVAVSPRAVKAPSFDGHSTLEFFPSDIKALTSLLWANAPPSTRFLGTRCEAHGPAVDENGRIIDESCFDLNPGLWHLIVTHQLGLEDRGLVADMTYDDEVWNYPVYGYRLTYFNPETHAVVPHPGGAIVSMADFKSDWFTKYRSSAAKFALGVAMDVLYTVEMSPHMGGQGAPLVRDEMLVYDLELDQDLKILGGEWYQNSHPDFAWTFGKGSEAVSAEDFGLTGDWDPTSSPLPASWQAAAGRLAPKGIPLASVIKHLVQVGLSSPLP